MSGVRVEEVLLHSKGQILPHQSEQQQLALRGLCEQLPPVAPVAEGSQMPELQLPPLGGGLPDELEERKAGGKPPIGYYRAPGERCRMYECHFCERKFGWKSNLIDHLRTHTGEKPFKCSLCPMAFARRLTMITHQRTHTGEKPFKCMLCPKRFARKDKRDLHMRTHRPEGSTDGSAGNDTGNALEGDPTA